MFIAEGVEYVGVNDHEVDLFEGQYAVKNGMAYNSYVIKDEKIAVMDTVDANFTEEWLNNLKKALGGKSPDYLIVQHMEPDHSANIANFMSAYPDATIVSSAKAFAMMEQFFKTQYENRRIVAGDGDTLCLGSRTLTFVSAPMVHWPEVIVTYDDKDEILFSADGFGKFGALDRKEEWTDEARRYYIGIVGKYGMQVQNLLKKAATLEIKMICPLHGPVWRENLGWFIEKYDTWSSYKPEDQAVMFAYASIYGNTENAAEILASKLADKGVKNISMYDVSVTDPSVIVSESFRCSHLVFAAPSYNGGIFTKMETVLSELKAHSLQNRTVAIMENGTWAPVAGRQMREIFAGMKNIELLEEGVTIRSAVKEAQEASLEALAEKIASSLQ